MKGGNGQHFRCAPARHLIGPEPGVTPPAVPVLIVPLSVGQRLILVNAGTRWTRERTGGEEGRARGA